MAINGYCIIIVRLVYVFITRAIEKSYVSLAARVALWQAHLVETMILKREILIWSKNAICNETLYF